MERYPNFAAMVQKICVLTRADVIEWKPTRQFANGPIEGYKTSFADLKLVLIADFLERTSCNFVVDEFEWPCGGIVSQFILDELFAVIRQQRLRLANKCKSEDLEDFADEDEIKQTAGAEPKAAAILEKLRDASA